MSDKEFTTSNAEKFQGEYSDERFWNKLKRHAAKAGGAVVYVALQLYYVMMSGKVSIKDKALIVGALGYLILPADLIPDFLPVLGYTDDLTAMRTVLNLVKNNIDDDIRNKARGKTNEILGHINQEVFRS